MSPRVSTADTRRRLPSVEVVVANAERLLDGDAPGARVLLTGLARARLAQARRDGGVDGAERLAEELADQARLLLAGIIRPVINATGVVLQTNLGRAPLSAEALRRVADVAAGYATLEYDVGRGRRAERAGALAATFEALLGVPAVVVNNNAASLLLSLFALARGREVLVSRGELIEIGGSFRLPDVMRLSGARLVEVGTTNRTRVEDYREAITPRTAMVLKVHTSNYRVVGFTESVAAADLAELARGAGIVAMEDLGSGSLVPTEEAGLAHEPTVREGLASGMDLVAFSGDKLLGGPQAGIVAGRADLIGKLARSSLYRALRPDKMTLAALEATLLEYLRRGDGGPDLPVWRMIRMTSAQTRARAKAWAAAAGTGEVVPVESAVGGGSLPGQTLAGFGLALGSPGKKPSATVIARRLREAQPPVIGRVHQDQVLLDPRTVAESQDADLVAAVRAATT